MASSNQNVVIMTDHYSKHSRVTPSGKITSKHLLSALLDSLILTRGIQRPILEDNGVQLDRPFFTTSGFSLGFNKLRTTAHSQQTNNQFERYNRTIVARLPHYVSKDQKKCGTYVKPFLYACSKQTHRTAETFPLNVKFPRKPPSAATFDKQRC